MTSTRNVRFGFVAAALFALSLVARAQHKQPNIVFILADDMGYGDISRLNENSKISTPQLDRFASEGIVFTDAHSSSAVCTPTRYGILTGRYNWRSTLKDGVLGGYAKALIPEDRATMATMLKAQGYRTACIGKWHLGWTWADVDKGIDSIDYAKPITDGPITRGFDYFYGIAASLDMAPYVYVENDMPTAVPDRKTEGEAMKVGDPGYRGAFWREGATGRDFRHEDCLPNLVRRAVEYVGTNAKETDPYFLYLALPAPHTPLLPSEQFRGKSGISAYADFVMMVDDEIGKVLTAIEESGEKGNTIVVFASDNGFAPAADTRSLEDKGHYPSYDSRGYKADLFDGGHHIPCIVRWPDSFRPATVDRTICLTDFMATFASITGYQLAADEGEDSFDLQPLLADPNTTRYTREATVSHSVNGSFAIRKGDWKLLFTPNSGGWSPPQPGRKASWAGLPPYQLYNMASDPSETHNMYDERQDIVEQLEALLLKYIEDGRSTPGKRQYNDGQETRIDHWKQN